MLDGWTRLKYGKNVSGENYGKMCCGPTCRMTNEVMDVRCDRLLR